MSRNRQLRKILLCLGMEGAALLGAPIRPDEVEDLLRNAQLAKVESTIAQEQEGTDDPVPPDLEDALLPDFAYRGSLMNPAAHSSRLKAGLVEETLFRGFIMTELRSSGWARRLRLCRRR